MAKKIKMATKSEYAKSKGWDPSYVTKLSRKGLLVEVDGKINTVATDKRIKEAQDPARDRFRKEIKGNGRVKTTKKDIEPNEGAGDLSYNQARTERERIKAKKEKIENDTLIGKLLDSEGVELSAV